MSASAGIGATGVTSLGNCIDIRIKDDTTTAIAMILITASVIVIIMKQS